MFVLHAHWRPPRRPTETGGMLIWAETSEAQKQIYLRGRLPKKHPPRDHPFCLSADVLRERIGTGTPLGDAETQSVKIRLPATRTGPIPSPDLAHNWILDTETSPFMAPWLVDGLWLTASKAFGVLVNLPMVGPDNLFVLGQDTHYWRKVANLVLETLASQKIVPVLLPIKNNGSYIARWQPVLDGAIDGSRLSLLSTSMPPICQMDLLHPNGRYHTGDIQPAQDQLNTFVESMCDALVRSWAKSNAPYFKSGDDTPFHAWLRALFNEDATVQASHAQLQALESSLRSWMRYLHAAGDGNFRIAFQLDAPHQEEILGKEGAWNLRFMLQARDDPSLIVPAEEVWRKGDSSLQYLGRRFDNPQDKLLAGLGYAARLFPPLLPGLQTSHPTSTTLDTSRAYIFLRETVPLLNQAGFGVLVPPWWNQNSARLGVRLRLRPGQDLKITSSSGILGMQNLVEYQWELALGNTTLTRQEFNALAALKSPLVQIRGQWVQLDNEQIDAAIEFWEKQKHTGTMSLLEAAKYGLDGQGGVSLLPVTEVLAEDWVEEWLGHLGHHERMIELDQPSGMQGELRPYQRSGYSWMSFFRRWGMGACLADDMGLGKTIQALALLQYEKENQQLQGPTLLICPTSVVTNWEREALRFTPALNTLIHQGPNRYRNNEFIEKAKNVDLVLSSYAVVRMDADLLQQVHWYGVILDEAQNIKNPSAKQTQIVRKIPSTFRFALTGTPVENRLSELWSIMNFLNPGYLASLESFRRDYAIPIERFGDPKATERLKKLVGPFVLRRVKSDPNIIHDLPEKIEMKEYCNLVEEQATLYEAAVRNTMERIESSEGMERRGLVLSLLMQLKQICNHPLQYLHQVEATSEDKTQISGRSGKLIRLRDLLEEILAAGDRALIFTQFVEMGKILSAYLPPTLGYTVQFLHGGTPTKMRDQMVRRFQEDDQAPPVLILSLKAGGTGLNLTSANHVFHFDRWWNPAVEDQATDRAYRIGQSRNVQVRKFITIGTLEERIDELIESKKGLAEAIIGAGEQWLTELTTEELRQLVELRR